MPNKKTTLKEASYDWKKKWCKEAEEWGTCNGIIFSELCRVMIKTGQCPRFKNEQELDNLRCKK